MPFSAILWLEVDVVSRKVMVGMGEDASVEKRVMRSRR